MTTPSEILRLADELESALKEQPYAGPNTTIPARIRFIAGQLAGHDRNAASIARKIALKADLFYSARKHLNVPGGAQLLWAEMTFSLLGQLRSQAAWRERQGR